MKDVKVIKQVIFYSSRYRYDLRLPQLFAKALESLVLENVCSLTQTLRNCMQMYVSGAADARVGNPKRSLIPKAHPIHLFVAI